ncbi:MAG: T9SS type A sorting domain-containing protein [Ignavibacteriales bacterium]|nr:T9SS type A sorting domain-containing protein [Ignavibacteriales bacterium]
MRKWLKLFFLISLCLATLSVSNAQIPNAGFETWTDGTPTGWVTDNVAPLFIPITQSNDAHSGTSSMQGATIQYLTNNYPAEVSADFSISARYSSFKGWYKFTSVGGDTLYFHAILYKGTNPIAGAQFFTGVSVSSYTQFNVPMTYFSSEVPDAAMIEIINISSGAYHLGTTYNIDDLSFGSETGVQESVSEKPAGFALSQNYPNPFNPSTAITYQLPTESMVRLEIYDVMGRTLAILVNEEKPAGQFTATFDGSKFTSGIYFYRLNVTVRDGKSFSQTNKMILMK